MKRILLYLILMAHIGYAQEKQLDSLFTSLYDNNEFNGNVLIADAGHIVFEKSYGLADEAQQKELDSNSMFELASVSKQFTAMGIVQLQKEGKLKYTDLISEYIPELAFYGTITIENLLYHTSGLPDYMELMEKHWDKTKFATNLDIVNVLQEYKPELDFETGQEFAYSNTGYALLALIIEKVSHQSYGKYLKEKIFDPLDMSRTTVYQSRYQPRVIEDYALGYLTIETTKDKVLPDCLGKQFLSYYLDGIVGDGMVNSTTHDLLKWDRALYDNQIINDTDRKMIFTSGKTKDGENTDYGLGWFLAKDKNAGQIAYHSGGWAGYITYIERDLDQDKTIILLQNNQANSTTIPIQKVRDILYNIPVELPNKEDLISFSGKYFMDDDKEVEFYLKDNILYTNMIPDHEMKLIPIAKNKFKLNGFHPGIFIDFKELTENKHIVIVEQPVYAVKMVGVK